MTWARETIEKLKELRSAGFSLSQIAERMGTTRNAVAGKIHRLGLCPPNEGADRPPPRMKATANPPRPKPAQVVSTTRITDLRGDQCRYVIGEPCNLTFCGQPQRRGTSYCEEHAAECYCP